MRCNSVCLDMLIFVNDIICIGSVCLIVLLFVVDNEKYFVKIIGKCNLNIICKIFMIGSCSKFFFNYYF